MKYKILPQIFNSIYSEFKFKMIKLKQYHSTSIHSVVLLMLIIHDNLLFSILTEYIILFLHINYLQSLKKDKSSN